MKQKNKKYINRFCKDIIDIYIYSKSFTIISLNYSINNQLT